jgi:hypothetical protein
MKQKFNTSFFSSESALIGYLVFVKILLHLLLPEYGFHRDELFYIAISDQFSFENMDILPLTPLFLKLFTTIFGYSIKSLHFASGLCGALTLLFNCMITRELGGKKYAILLTGIFFLFSGFIIFGATFTYDSLDLLICVYALYLLVRIFRENKPKLWILLGIVLGLGLLNKLTILFWGFIIFVSLWLVPQRVYFKSKWIWLAGIIALFFSLPFIIWQYHNNWYFMDFAANYAGGISYVASFPEFLWNQILPNNIFTLPVWATGLGLLLFSSKWRQYRYFGFMYVFLFFLFYLIGAKFYFLISIYSILFAVGSIKIEEFFNNRGIQKTKIKIAMIVVPVAFVLLSIPFLPMVVPTLPVEQLVKFVGKMGVDAGVRTENRQITQLPQHIADRFGWEEMVEQVNDVYNNIPYEEKEKVGIMTGNWGQAGAIHLLGRNYDLPEPISLQGWYYFETLRKHQFKDTYLSIGMSQENLQNIFEEVVQKDIYTNPYCMPDENNKCICLCRKPKYDLRDYWLMDRNIDPHFVEILQNESVLAAIAYYHECRKKNPSIMMFSERQINLLGYEYLRKGKLEDAIALFKLNVEVYPASSNVYDSLGEGYMENSQYELAIKNYKKSLELNPNNANARKMLKKLEKNEL